MLHILKFPTDKVNMNQTICVSVYLLQKELLDIRNLIEREDNIQRLSRKLTGIKKKRVSSCLFMHSGFMKLESQVLQFDHPFIY